MAVPPECSVQTSLLGSTRFRIDVPRYLEAYLQGRPPLDEMITRHRRLAGISDAFRAMQASEVVRKVLTFD